MFARGETCGDDLAIYDAAAPPISDRPDACTVVEIEPRSDRSFRFAVSLALLKAQTENSSGYGTGVGIAPVEGIATRVGGGWKLKQLFKPKPPRR
jgi:hypothetical protein